MMSRAVLVFAITLLLYIAAIQVFGANKSVEGDSAQYLGIAQSLAGGNGYKDTAGPWPSEPACDRMPVWPLILSGGLRLLPLLPADAVSRYVAALCMAIASTSLFFLSLHLGLLPLMAMRAAWFLALSPILVFLAVTPLSEVSFVMLVVSGLLLCLGKNKQPYIGALLFGLAALVRSNFVIVPVLWLSLALIFPAARSALRRRWSLTQIILLLSICYSPVAIWLARNYQVSGRFPLLSTLEGETLYGANNDRVANDLDVWGYWIMPDGIPGETPKLQLALTLGSDLALNDYYLQQAKDWTAGHRSVLPRLWLGKWIRAFVPIPWRPLLETYLSYSYRVVLLIGFCLLAPFWWPAIDRSYLLFLLAMFVAHAVTTTMFYGASRFTHCFVEIFWIPCIFIGYQRWRR